MGVIIVSAAIVRWVNTRPGYDPYGWLIWGYQTLHLHLDLGGAPSWKPLPLLFTVPYALFGHYALWLWMVTAEAAAFAGSIFAGRIAYRVVNSGGNGDRRYVYAAIAAALFAGLGMYGIQDNINGAHSNYLHYVLSVQSDPMIVTLVLAAIDFHINGHRRWVIAMLLLAGLGRPEVWPVLGLYGLWCWVKRPDMRIYLGVCAFLLVFLWFGVPTITNGRPFVAGDLAQGSPRECRSGKILCTIDRFKTLNLWPVWVFTLAAVAWAGYRLRATGFRLRGARAALSDDTLAPAQRTERNNDLLVLGLAAGIVVWLIVEIAFALHGWPAVPRYIFEPAVVAIVLGGIGFGWVLREIPARLRLLGVAGRRGGRRAGVGARAGRVVADPRRAQGRQPRARPHRPDQPPGGNGHPARRAPGRAALRQAGDQRRVRQHPRLAGAPQRRGARSPPELRAAPAPPDRALHPTAHGVGELPVAHLRLQARVLPEHEAGLSDQPWSLDHGAQPHRAQAGAADPQHAATRLTAPAGRRPPPIPPDPRGRR